MSCKIVFLKTFIKLTVKYLCWNFFFDKVAGLVCSFVKKETLVQVLSSKFLKSSRIRILRNTTVTASEVYNWLLSISHVFLQILNCKRTLTFSLSLFNIDPDMKYYRETLKMYEDELTQVQGMK